MTPRPQRSRRDGLASIAQQACAHPHVFAQIDRFPFGIESKTSIYGNNAPRFCYFLRKPPPFSIERQCGRVSENARRSRRPTVLPDVIHDTLLYIHTILILYSNKALTLESGASIVKFATSKESAMRSQAAHTTVSPTVCGAEKRFPFMFNLTPLDARINCGHRHFGIVSHAYSYRYL